jgi:hypothetical protein
MTYKLLTGGGVYLDHGNGFITSMTPDETNGDWRKYLAWLAEGNEPEPAEPEPEPGPTREEKEAEAAGLLRKLGASEGDAARLAELLTR